MGSKRNRLASNGEIEASFGPENDVKSIRISLCRKRTADTSLVDTVVVAETSNNVVLDAEDELELVVAVLLEDDGRLLELVQVLGLVESLEDDVSSRTVLEQDVHLNNNDATGVILGCCIRSEKRRSQVQKGRRPECHSQIGNTRYMLAVLTSN